jgi:two-component system, NarL family, nitrate/nitrite response regulator NarL
LKRR